MEPPQSAREVYVRMSARVRVGVPLIHAALTARPAEPGFAETLGGHAVSEKDREMGDLVSDRFRSRLTGGSQFFLHIDSYRYSICVVSDTV